VEKVKVTKKVTPPVKDYLREGLLALVPDYRSGYKSTVITKRKSYPDSRSVNWLAQMIARYHCLDYSLMMKRSRSVLEQRHNISLAFNAGLVLIPVKLKVAKSQNELATGSISLNEIEDIVTMPAGSGRIGPAWLSKIIFKNGKQLFTLNSKKTLQERMRHGQRLLSDYQLRNGSNDFNKTLRPGSIILLALFFCLYLLSNTFNITIIKPLSTFSGIITIPRVKLPYEFYHPHRTQLFCKSFYTPSSYIT